ncbi:hypothetical protein P7C73_g110, partial [Tremellales sp. Uapishka_1]
MPKRKANPSAPVTAPALSISSFDAALDILASDTLARLDSLADKFEVSAGIKLKEGVVRARWEEAVKRRDVMKSMEKLCCGMVGPSQSSSEIAGEIRMEESDVRYREHNPRPFPSTPHPGAVSAHSLSADEVHQWKRWTPKVGDVVLVQLAEGDCWPGKMIERKTFYQGRTVPRGNHFFPIRIYRDDLAPVVTIKSRLIPLSFRPNPPIMASTSLISAYHHAANPVTFDMLAAARESLAAHNRTLVGVANDENKEKWKQEKEAWRIQVNWVMDERRLEKIRAVGEERERRLREVAKSAIDLGENGDVCETGKDNHEADDWLSKKRKVALPLAQSDDPPSTLAKMLIDSSMNDRGGLFKISPLGSINSRSASPHTPIGTSFPQRTGSPLLAAYIRPALSIPSRPNSPRRLAAVTRRGSSVLYTGMGEYSPRGRTYTPPRVLPSGDETAPNASPAPTLHKFDFVSPLGPVRFGKLDGDLDRPLVRSGSISGLDVVKEETGEESGDDWNLCQKDRRRAGSAPCRDKAREMAEGATDADAMEL